MVGTAIKPEQGKREELFGDGAIDVGVGIRVFD